MNVEDYETMNVGDVYKTNEILLASVRIKDTNLVTRLNTYFGLTREFYYGKILYADKQNCTIRVIRDLDTNSSNIPKEKIFSTERTSVEFLQVDQIPIAEVYKDIYIYLDLVKVPNNNYGRAQQFIRIVGNTVTFKTDQGTFDTANIMDTLVVHGQTKYLFSESSFLYKWWEKNKKDVVKRKAYNVKQREEERLAAVAAEEERKRRSNRALENLAKLAEQKEAEEAAEQKQREAEEERKQRKAEEEERKREEEERAKQQAEAAKQAKKKREQNKRKKTQKPRRSSRLENMKKKQRRESARITKKKSQLHEEYTEKLKF